MRPSSSRRSMPGKPGANGCFREPQPVRLMLSYGMRRPGRVGFAVCKGNTEYPKRSCEWLVIKTYESHEDALAHRDRMDEKEGRAVVRLDYQRLVVLTWEGEIVQHNEQEDELLL